MDQETHDAAVGKKVAAALRQVSSDKRTDGPVAFALALVAVELDLLLSPPAKPEAKLEPLPTTEQWVKVASRIAWWLEENTLDADYRAAYLAAMPILRGLASGRFKIVDERGKGAEAERLAPTLDDYSAQITLAELRALDAEKSGCRPTARDRIELARLKKERAERFPGER